MGSSHRSGRNFRSLSSRAGSESGAHPASRVCKAHGRTLHCQQQCANEPHPHSALWRIDLSLCPCIERAWLLGLLKYKIRQKDSVSLLRAI